MSWCYACRCVGCRAGICEHIASLQGVAEAEEYGELDLWF